MLLRWLWRFLRVTLAHAVTSCVGVVIAIAAAMCPGGGVVAGALYCALFFPVLLLSCVGVEPVPLDSPLVLAVNSPMWAAVSMGLWFLASRLRRRETDGSPPASWVRPPEITA
jgi:hypothetical protein